MCARSGLLVEANTAIRREFWKLAKLASIAMSRLTLFDVFVRSVCCC